MKKKILISLLVFSALILCSFSVMAADEGNSGGFYDIGTKENVTIKVYNDTVEVTNATEEDVDGDGDPDQIYVNSNRLEVSFGAATQDEYYGIMLAEGNVAPTKDTEIYFVDQVTAASGVVDFNVFPRFPENTTDLTLYISSSENAFGIIKIPLNYAVATAPAVRGFHDIGSTANVVITPKADGDNVTATTAVINGVKTDDFYSESNGLVLSYNNATPGVYYGVILVDIPAGSTVPTRDGNIYYINQHTAQSTTLDFKVYPKLPAKACELKLYISSSAPDSDLIEIPLNYYVDPSAYILGDVDNNGKIDSSDSYAVLQIAAGYPSTETERLAANVSGDAYINSTDALMILQYHAELIDSWN